MNLGILLLVCAVFLIRKTHRKPWLFPITMALRKDLYEQ